MPWNSLWAIVGVAKNRLRSMERSSGQVRTVPLASEAAARTDEMLVLQSDDGRWLDFLAQHPDALPFQHPSWSEVLSESYGFRPFVLAVADGGGPIHAGIPVLEIRRRFREARWVSLPFTDRCPPLLGDAVSTESFVDLVARLCEREQVRRLDIRADLPGDLHRRPSGVTHLLTLEHDADSLFERFTPAVRRNVRKAQRSRLSLRRAETQDDVTTSFYGLHLRTRRRLGVPVQPLRFFELLWRHVIAPGLGFVLLAELEGVPVAGAVFLTAGRTVIYKYGASERSASSLRPNNLIFWEALRWSAENGFAAFDFGRSDEDNHGLRAFKNGWSAVEQPLVYATFGNRPPSIAPRGASLLAPFIRSGPAWVCRALGTVGYRRAA